MPSLLKSGGIIDPFAVIEKGASSVEPGREPAKVVALTFDTPDGERTVHARKKPLGIQFRAVFPLTVKCEPEGHGKELGVEVGWVLKAINSIDVSSMTDMNQVNEILYREVGEKTVPITQWSRPEPASERDHKVVALTWDTPDGVRIVYARKKPLGVDFRAVFPLKVKREPEGHGKELGIEVGWILKAINGLDVSVMTDMSQLNEILYKEVGVKTRPLDNWI
jgi:hypothetical protein